MNEQTRADFEAFHGARRSKGVAWREGMFARRPDGTYVDDSVQRHWWTWQNALSSVDAANTSSRRVEISLGNEQEAAAAGHGDVYAAAYALLREAAPPAGPDAARLDYLQAKGATVDLVSDGYADDGSLYFAFRVGGLRRAVSRDLREAIDAAIGLKTTGAGHADST